MPTPMKPTESLPPPPKPWYLRPWAVVLWTVAVVLAAAAFFAFVPGAQDELRLEGWLPRKATTKAPAPARP